MTLYAYQSDLVALLEAHFAKERKVAFIAPTGSGKSLMVTTLLGRLRRDGRFARAIVCVPQTHIKDSFGYVGQVEDPARQPRFTDTEGLATFDTSVRSTAELEAHLAGRGCRFALVSTHATVASKDAFRLLKRFPSLAGQLLVVDEGHHSSNDRRLNQLSRFRDEWLARGGAVLLSTATPFRMDGSPVLDETWARVSRTMAEHTLGGVHAPEFLRCEHRWLARPAKSRRDLNCGVESSRKLVGAIVADWANEARGPKGERPKTMIIVPQANSQQWTEMLIETFGKIGCRTFDATGATAAKRNEVRRVLAGEAKVRRWRDSAFDVMLGCKRFDEGTDWAPCSLVYVIGFPTSLTATVQRWGRATRNKRDIAGHPFRDRATIVFYSPTWSDELRQDMLTVGRLAAHREVSHLLAAHTHDWETAQAFVEPRAALWSKSSSSSQEADRLRQALQLDAGEEAQAIVDIDKASFKLGLRPGARLDPGQVRSVVSEVHRQRGERRAEIVAQFLFERGTLGAKSKAETLAAISAEARSPGLAQSLIRTKMRRAFRRVVRDVDVFYIDHVADQRLTAVADWTGETIVTLCRHLRSARVRRTKAGFAAFVAEHVRNHGSVPLATTDIAWADWAYDRGTSFTAELVAIGYTPRRTLKTRSFEGIEADVQQYAEQHGVGPSKEDSKEWNAIDAWLIRHQQMSLSTLVASLGVKAVCRRKRAADAIRQRGCSAPERSLRWWAAKQGLLLSELASTTGLETNSLYRQGRLSEKSRQRLATALGTTVENIVWDAARRKSPRGLDDDEKGLQKG